MKRTSYLFFFIFFSASCALCQINFFEKENDFVRNMHFVLQDFSTNFRSIDNGLVLVQGETEVHASKVHLPGSDSCFITRYHSNQDSSATWHAVIFKGEHFKNATTKYIEIFKQLKKCYIKLIDNSEVYLNGVIEQPKEELRFCTSFLTLQTSDLVFKNLEVELEIANYIDNWVVQLHINFKKKDNDE